MKNLNVFTITKLWGVTLLIYFLSATQIFAQRYGFETAEIDKTSKQIVADMIIIEVTQKIYVIGAGFKEAHYKTEKQTNLMTNQVEEKRSVTITAKEWIITFDPETKKGTRMKNTFFDNFKGKSEKDQQKFSEGIADAMNTDVKEIGTEEIAGKLCTVTLAETKNMGIKTKTYLYKNFVMKLESESPGMSLVERVTRFQENAVVNPTVFLIADEIELQTVKLPQ